MPFFIFLTRIAPKYFKNDVAQRIQALWLGLRSLRNEDVQALPVGFVTERLRFVYIHAPKMPHPTCQAQTWCSDQTAVEQKLLPTPGQSWQHRAFFAHTLLSRAPNLPFCDRPLPRCDNPPNTFPSGERR
ncbi:hypothetical protein [Pseudomonas cannabina]|uniref:hypothetical protein n=1 Tax=Pseudomonas cannabina TaxID=86840 RepID=UPI0012E1BB40|nr:hypothetical protein [Pseudomonas cannabina]